MLDKCWLLLFLPTSLPPTEEAVPACSHPHPPTHAQVPSPPGLLLTVPAGAPAFPPLYVLVIGFLPSVVGVSVSGPASLRANQSSPAANGSTESRASSLLGDPGQEAESHSQSLSQVSGQFLSAPYPSGPQEHSGPRATLASQNPTHP